MLKGLRIEVKVLSLNDNLKFGFYVRSAIVIKFFVVSPSWQVLLPPPPLLGII